LRARLPAHDGLAVAVPWFDHRVLRGDQADALAGFEAMVAGVAGVSAAGQPDPAFEHGQFAAAAAQAQRAARRDAA